MRKLVYYVALSLDGYIAREDGSGRGFLTDGEAVAEYLETVRTYDTVLMGRTTYESGYAYGVAPGQPSPIFPGVHYVFSKTLRFDAVPHERLRVIDVDPVPVVRQLKSQPGSDVYLCGGGALAGYLLGAGLIDEVIIKLNPLVLGSGIRLFGDHQHEARLTLRHSKGYPDGMVVLTYAVAN